jgi:hypothetical protein
MLYSPKGDSGNTGGRVEPAGRTNTNCISHPAPWSETDELRQKYLPSPFPLHLRIQRFEFGDKLFFSGDGEKEEGYIKNHREWAFRHQEV